MQKKWNLIYEKLSRIAHFVRVGSLEIMPQNVKLDGFIADIFYGTNKPQNMKRNPKLCVFRRKWNKNQCQELVFQFQPYQKEEIYFFDDNFLTSIW